MSGVARRDGEDATALMLAKWLHFAAAPTFAVMALVTVVLDSGLPNALCSAAGHVMPGGGMAPMYVLMAAFHLVPWLKLISSRRDVVEH